MVEPTKVLSNIGAIIQTRLESGVKPDIHAKLADFQGEPLSLLVKDNIGYVFIASLMYLRNIM